MSAGEPLALPSAESHARALLELLRDVCDEVLVAGSIRRRRPLVHDIELVAVPHLREVPVPSLFDDVEPLLEDALALRLAELRADGTLTPWTNSKGITCWGPSHVRAWYHPPQEGPDPPDPFPLDLYAGPLEELAVRYVLRTGPAGYSHALVTPQGQQAHIRGDPRGDYYRPGLLPPGYIVKDCRVYGGDGRLIPTPTEQSFYTAIGLKWAEPWARR